MQPKRKHGVLNLHTCSVPTLDQIPANFPQSQDLLWSIVYAIVITIIRILFTKLIATPLGICGMHLSPDEPDLSQIPPKVREQFADYNQNKMIAEKKVNATYITCTCT